MGTLWNRSGVIERFADDIRATGAKAYFFLGGTTTPMSVYQDAGESSAHTHPLEADANGRWPDVFVPYIDSYDVLVTSADDVQLTFTQEIPNPNPVDVTVTVPPEETVTTGMIHAELINTTKTGYVRLNGRTMGNGASGATERANADTEDLFAYLWNNLTNTIAPVSGGRGGSAAADYAANKTITLPDMRGRALVGLDDMGASAASAFTGLTFAAGNATTAGASLGANALTLIEANLPSHTHTGTTAAEAAHTHTGTTDATSHSHTASGTTVSINTHNVAVAGGATSLFGAAGGAGSTSSGISVTDPGISTESAHTHAFTSAAGSSHSHTFTTASTGSGTAVNNLGLAALITWFIKL